MDIPTNQRIELDVLRLVRLLLFYVINFHKRMWNTQTHVQDIFLLRAFLVSKFYLTLSRRAQPRKQVHRFTLVFLHRFLLLAEYLRDQSWSSPRLYPSLYRLAYISIGVFALLSVG